MGFAVPLKHWFRGQAADLVRDVLLSKSARERGIFRPQELQRLVDGHHRGRDLSSQLWAAVFFESWCQKWLDHSLTAVAAASMTVNPEFGSYSLSRSNDGSANERLIL
jgi:asparagine synthase (glutamine-hydrolysing)